MTTNNGNAEAGQLQGQTSGKDDTSQTKQFKAITSQEELDKILGARVYEERGKYADYDELKSAKVELDKIKEANKTELEKAIARAEAAEAKNAAHEKNAQIAGWRSEVRKDKGLPEDADSLLTGSTLDEIKAQADKLVGLMPKGPAKPVVPSDKGENFSQTGGKDADYAALAEALTGG